MDIVFGLLFCVFLAFIWIEYFRRIDIFENEKKWFLVFVFIMGLFSTFLVDLFHSLVLSKTSFHLNGNWANDLLFCMFSISAVEEITKFLPLLITIFFFKKHLNETIDYIVYAAVSAIGFACFENVLYFLEHGFKIIAVRSVTALPSHIFDSVFFVYGIVLYRFNPAYQNKKWIIAVFIAFAIFSHGIYDFFLLGDIPFGYISMLIYYLLMISAFVTILGNALNNSSLYTPKKFIDSKRLTEFLFSCYFALWIISSIFFFKSAKDAKEIITFLANMVWKDLFLVMVLIFRVSRFKIIPGRWNKVRLELPFILHFKAVYTGPPTTKTLSNYILPNFVRVQIKGETYNETYLNYFFDKNLIVQPVSVKKSYLKKRHDGILDLKLFLRNDEVFYVLIVFGNEGTEYFYIKSKQSGRQRFGKFPIVALLKGPPLAEINEHHGMEDFQFIEWVVLKLKKN